jgi:hypothetical protein
MGINPMLGLAQLKKDHEEALARLDRVRTYGQRLVDNAPVEALGAADRRSQGLELVGRDLLHIVGEAR